jgi:hypothetical protein
MNPARLPILVAGGVFCWGEVTGLNLVFDKEIADVYGVRIWLLTTYPTHLRNWYNAH